MLANLFLTRTRLRIFAAGSPEASAPDLPKECPTAWSYSRFLDASIAAILSARLVIATDSGLAHPAVWCGTPVLIITHADNRVAPGPVRDGANRIVRTNYWEVDIKAYRCENHTSSPVILLPNSWHTPDKVVNEACRILSAVKSGAQTLL
jgi:ADP-heptose:LPS heptosyltransferase